MTNSTNDPWDQLWAKYDSFRVALGRSRAVNVNASSLREGAGEIVQIYFRQVRPELVSLRLEGTHLEAADSHMHALLRLSQGRNPKRSYVQVLRALGRVRPALAAARELRLGEGLTSSTERVGSGFDETEERILETLKSLLPSAALSYEQAISDLRLGDRVSFRGTADELRETLREVLHKLAPDKEITKAPDFKLEEGAKGPTVRQRAEFILRSRNEPGKAIKAAGDTVSQVEAAAASLMRSTFDLANLSTHVARERGQVRQLKMYVDTALAELLQIHRE